MKCYAEGTNRGLVKIKDIEKQGECMLIIPSYFTERVQAIHYSVERNLLFISSRDGKLKAWKVPNEWRSQTVDRQEQDYQIKQRTTRMTATE
jgi:hypothetical protein